MRATANPTPKPSGSRLGTWLSGAAALSVLGLLSLLGWQYWEGNRFRERFCEEQSGWATVDFKHPKWIDAAWDWWKGSDDPFGHDPPFLPWFDRIECLVIKGSGPLDRQWFQNVSRATEVGSVYFQECSFRESDLSLLAVHQDVDHVEFQQTPVTDAAISHLRAFRRLKQLNLDETDVTDAGLAECASFSELKMLSISSNRITGKGLRPLRALSQLTVMEFFDMAWTDEGFDALSGISSVTELRIESVELNAHRMKCLGRLKRLESLHFVDVTPTESLGPLSELSELHRLLWFGGSLDNADFTPLSKLRSLDWAWFDGTDVTDAQIRALAGLPALRILALSGPQVRGTAFQKPGWKSLHDLSLHGTQITDDVIDAMASLPAIRQIDLKGTSVTAEGIERLRSMQPNCAITADDAPR